ncbi:UNVERIFIED_CONTAM: hypothetical protein FKN15_068100 [Acipenser sinensis]
MQTTENRIPRKTTQLNPQPRRKNNNRKAPIGYLIVNLQACYPSICPIIIPFLISFIFSVPRYCLELFLHNGTVRGFDHIGHKKRVTSSTVWKQIAFKYLSAMPRYCLELFLHNGTVRGFDHIGHKKRARFTVTLGVKDSTNDIVTKLITIVLADANDNRPIFINAPYNEDVSENVTEGTVLFKVTATDADENAFVTYSIDEVVPDNAENHDLFVIERNGDVKLNGILNYNDKSTYYQLKINATIWYKNTLYSTWNLRDIDFQREEETLCLDTKHDKMAIARVKLNVPKGMNLEDPKVSEAILEQLLLERGATVDAADKDLVTPLHLAAGCGSCIAVHLLMQYGGSEGSTDLLEMTPLHYSALNGFAETAKNVLCYGADKNAKERLGETPLHLASETKFKSWWCY